MSIVMKFGGTSVGSAGAMRQAASLVERALPRAPLVVLSAMGGVTNALFAAAEAAANGQQSDMRRLRGVVVDIHQRCAAELFAGAVPSEVVRGMQKLFEELRVLLRGVFLLRELSPRSMDMIASTGERLSSWIFASWMARRGANVESFDAREIMRTDRRFGRARPEVETLSALARECLAPRLHAGRAIVTQGYIGASADGSTTTLGRGGSDYSAALFGAALGVEEVQIWTDVEGILTCDPRVVPAAEPIATISFAEAAELAAFGARVLHPATIQPAVEASIPVTVRHTHLPEGRHTTIRGDVHSTRAVTALAMRSPVRVLTVTSMRMLDASGFLGRLFDVFGRHAISVDLVATAEVSVSLTVESDAPIEPALAEIREFARVTVSEERAIVAVVGDRRNAPRGHLEHLFGALADVDVELVSMGANEFNTSFVVPSAQAIGALRALHARLFEGALAEVGG